MKYKIKCKVCGKEYETRNPRGYCSRKCYGLGQTLGLTSRKPGYSLNCICEYCGKEFIRRRKPTRSNPAFYCSNECANKAHGLKRITNRIGVSGEELGDIRRRAKYEKCAICRYDRFVEVCRILPGITGGIYALNNVVFLCPTHHRLFDRHLLNQEEIDKLPNGAKAAYTTNKTYNYMNRKNPWPNGRPTVLKDQFSGKFIREQT